MANLLVPGLVPQHLGRPDRTKKNKTSRLRPCSLARIDQEHTLYFEAYPTEANSNEHNQFIIAKIHLSRARWRVLIFWNHAAIEHPARFDRTLYRSLSRRVKWGLIEWGLWLLDWLGRVIVTRRIDVVSLPLRTRAGLDTRRISDPPW